MGERIQCLLCYEMVPERNFEFEYSKHLRNQHLVTKHSISDLVEITRGRRRCEPQNHSGGTGRPSLLGSPQPQGGAVLANSGQSLGNPPFLESSEKIKKEQGADPSSCDSILDPKEEMVHEWGDQDEHRERSRWVSERSRDRFRDRDRPCSGGFRQGKGGWRDRRYNMVRSPLRSRHFIRSEYINWMDGATFKCLICKMGDIKSRHYLKIHLVNHHGISTLEYRTKTGRCVSSSYHHVVYFTCRICSESVVRSQSTIHSHMSVHPITAEEYYKKYVM